LNLKVTVINNMMIVHCACKWNCAHCSKISRRSLDAAQGHCIRKLYTYHTYHRPTE